MRTLERVMARAEAYFATDSGTRFRGVMQPVSEGTIPIDTFAEPRVVLRVRRHEPVKTGDTFLDPAGRRYLVADHDLQYSGNFLLHRSHKIYRVTDQLSWKRTTTTLDPVTGLTRGSGEVELGPIWCVQEVYGREQMDLGLRIAEDRRRVITGHPVKLNDKIDGNIVKRIAPIFGVYVLETQ